MKIKKIIALSEQEKDLVQKEANEKEITFTEMIRRIINDRYIKR